MDVFFVAVFLFLSGCHILIEKSAIFITKMQFLSLEDITLQFLKTGKKKNYSKQQKCYTTSFRILSPNTERIFCRLVLISVSQPPTYYLLKLKSEGSMQKRVFCSKKLIFPFYNSPPNARKKNREIKRVLNDFVVTYQKNIPPTNLAKNSAVVN